MPPRKKAKTLVDLTIESLTLTLSNKYRSHEQLQLSDSSLESIRDLLEFLPVHLLEQLISRITYLLIGKDRQMSPFYSSFTSFPLQNVTQLDFSRLFHGFRLKRNQNTAFKEFCVKVLRRTIHLTKLVLIAKCTDKILEVLGTTCHNLRELNIALSDDISDKGLQELAPTSEGCDDKCSRLRLLDVTKCWNISPAGVAEMIERLPSLRRLCYSNMRAVASDLSRRNQDRAERLSYEVDYFECTDPKLQDQSVLKQGIVSELFPRISTLKLLISDEDVGNLVAFTGLQHVELEMDTVTPGSGFSKFFKHQSSSQLCQVVLQINSMTSDCLQMIADNCRNLKVFKFTGTTLIGEERLIVSSKYFNQLTHLEFKLYNSEGLYSSDEDDDGAGSPEVHPQIFDFFLQNSPHLIQVTFHVNCSRFMNLNFLSKLLAENPLVVCEKLSLDGPVPLSLDRSAVELVLYSLPSIRSLHVSRWEGVTEACLAEYRRESKLQNLDVEFF